MRAAPGKRHVLRGAFVWCVMGKVGGVFVVDFATARTAASTAAAAAVFVVLFAFVFE